jgi:hypothetical protein
MCYNDEWFSRLGEISFFIVLYLIAFPARLCWVYFQMTNKPDLRNHKEFQYLTNGYKPAFFWWDIVFLLKRTVFVMCSQFLFSSLDASLRLLTSAIGILAFTALELLYRPYQFHIVAKNNLNLMLILILLCQGMIFENEDSNATDVFVGFVVFIFVITTVHSCVVILQSGFARLQTPTIILDSVSVKKLQVETRRQVYELWSSEKSDLCSEIEMEIARVEKHQDVNFSIGDLLACQRLCDVMYGQYAVIGDKSTRNFAATAIHQGDEPSIQMSVFQKNQYTST